MSAAGSPIVDVVFPVRGSTIPADHAYSLFAALSRRMPTLHEESQIGIQGISGKHEPARRLRLNPASKLRLRMPLGLLELVLPLAGQLIELDGDVVTLGFPQILPLRPAATLQSRIVVIAGFMEPEAFVKAAYQQL